MRSTTMSKQLVNKRPNSQHDKETQDRTVVEEAFVFDDSVQVSGRGS